MAITAHAGRVHRGTAPAFFSDLQKSPLPTGAKRAHSHPTPAREGRPRVSPQRSRRRPRQVPDCRRDTPVVVERLEAQGSPALIGTPGGAGTFAQPWSEKARPRPGRTTGTQARSAQAGWRLSALHPPRGMLRATLRTRKRRGDKCAFFVGCARSALRSARYLMFITWIAAGPRMTMNSTGRKNRIIGTVSFGGSAAAFFSASDMRMSRFSCAITRNVWPSGVP